MRLRQTRRLIAFELVGLLAVAAIAALATIPALSADHLDAPTVKKDGRIDINDVYVFHPGSPEQNLKRTVLAMTVNPAAGVISGTTFRPNARYEFLIDTNGDARPDITIRAQFSSVENGEQDYTIRRIKGDDSKVIARGETEEIESEDGVKAYAGLRDDPFFFDLANFNNGATFCGAAGGLPVNDFFLGLNTSAIVVEVPTGMIGSGPVGVWGRTVVGGDQVERMGRPAILTVFIPPNPFEQGSTAVGNLEDQFNRTLPHRDQARWRGEVVNTLLALGNSQARADALADILLPDILTVDLSMSTGFLNGRNLADDVIDAELQLLLNNPAASDCIANDSTFSSGFPYLGVPN
ncbi:MAG TPA: DUF4331 family protein [Gaiellaceae bacterium]|nr:DUF4331 family protein [Gaiellaceae bacterium]